MKTITFIQVLILIVVAITASILLTPTNEYKDLLVLDARVMEVGDTLWDATAFYDEASISYEQEDFNAVQSNCRLARDKYSSHVQKLKVIRESVTGESKLLELRVEMIDESIIQEESMFEVCEHFESAVRYYDFYYNTDVPFDDPSFEGGNGQIEMMNEKIQDHDDSVRRHNDILARYTNLLIEELE